MEYESKTITAHGFRPPCAEEETRLGSRKISYFLLARPLRGGLGLAWPLRKKKICSKKI